MPYDMEKKHPLDPEMEKQAPVLAGDIRSGSVSGEILKHSHDADEAMKAFMSHEGPVLELDEATNRRLLRKIDWNLMPVRSISIIVSSGRLITCCRSCVSSMV